MNRLVCLVGGSVGASCVALAGPRSVFASSASDATKRVKLSELPIYDTHDDHPQQFEVEEPKLSALRSYIREMRIFTWGYVDSFENATGSVSEKYNTARSHTESFLSYLHEDSSVLARGAIITVAGLGGIIAGYRGGFLRKSFYCTLFASGGAAVCYPKEAAELVNRGRSLVRDTYAEIMSPSSESVSDSFYKILKDVSLSVSPPSHDTKPDNSLKQAEEGNRSEAVQVKEHVKPETSSAKKDFGMSKAEDKDLYANRSN